MQWSSSLEVLQKPYGMEPGEEVSDTVLVLAVHDHQPGFENGQVNYRFPVGRAVRTESAPSPAWSSSRFRGANSGWH